MTRLASAIFLAIALAALPARADEAQDAALAERLFRDGRELTTRGKLREACEKFRESKRLDPAPGTILNLAHCYEDLGRSASAWANYRELETRATKLGQAPRADFARQRAAEIEPTLPVLVVHVAAPSRIEGLVIDNDGSEIGAAAWEARIPIDPGTHRITAKAPGRLPWTTTVEAVKAMPVNVDIPILAERVEKSTTAVISAPAQRTIVGPTVGIVTAIVGGAALGTGLVFGGLAKVENDSARSDDCDARGCSSTGLDRIGRADDFARVSTLLTVSGAAICGVGLAVWFLSSRSSGRSSASALAGIGRF